MGTDEPIVSLRGVTVARGGRVVWSDVTLDVPAGEFVAVLGPNGAGKSTLLKLLVGLVRPLAGEVRVDGEPVRHGNPGVGYLPQRHSFDESIHIRARDVVRLGIDGDRLGIPLPAVLSRRSRAAEARVDELVARVEAQGYADRPIGELSGGQQQRLLIAQALARRPRLLLLDEPLDSLDLPSQAAVSALLGRIRAEEGVTVVIVAHDVNPILPHLDRVVYFAGGRAVSGLPAEVVTSETLSRLFGSEIEVLHTSDGRPVVVGGPDATSFHPGLHHAHDHGPDHVHG